MNAFCAILCAALLASPLFTASCALEHARMDIPPPGGCDRCHRQKIGSSWQISVTPVPLGREGGVMDSSDLILREVRQIPYHQDVPTKRLEVFAAAAPPEVVGEGEVGIQCFVCHRSPGPPHETLRGQFPHPWGGAKQGTGKP